MALIWEILSEEARLRLLAIMPKKWKPPNKKKASKTKNG